MFKAFVVIAAVLTICVAGVLLLAAMKPDTFEVKRSLAMRAPPDKIYPLIVDFKRWPQWSPYENRDPNMKRTYGQVSAGKGATYAWDGDKNIGSGAMEIVDAGAPSLVSLKLDFTRPFAAHNVVDFTLAPQGDNTVVTWDMRGPTPFLGKIIHVFFDMDRMVGGDFEAGLAKMKAVAEAN